MTKLYTILAELAWFAVVYIAISILVPVVKKVWRTGRALATR